MNIVISGFYGLGNTGDEAILAAIVENLREQLAHTELTVFSLAPDQTAHTYQVKAIYRGWRHDFKEKVIALKKADLLISGGGGLLQDTYPTRFLFGPLPYYLMIVFLAKLCRTKVMFFSQGIGPVTSTWGKILMKIFANMADFITVRDQFSKDYLQQLGINHPETVVTADIVFASTLKKDDACLASLNLTNKERLVAVSVRPWFEQVKQFEKIAQILDRFIEERHLTPVFIPMEGHHDYNASKSVLAHMRYADKCQILRTDFTPNQYLNFIGACQLTIGMRLHALIFSTIMGVPHIGISYDKKVESLLKRSGMWKYSTTLTDMNVEECIKNTYFLLNHRPEYHQLVKKNAEAMKQEALTNVTLLKKHFTPVT